LRIVVTPKASSARALWVTIASSELLRMRGAPFSIATETVPSVTWAWVSILLAIHRALPNLRQSESLAPFAFRIAHNRGVTHVARQAGARRAAQRVELDDPIPETPEEHLLASERANRVTVAVRRLPLPYRQVMTLLLEELSYAEIAEALDISLSNVGVRVNRAKAQLKAMLDDE